MAARLLCVLLLLLSAPASSAERVVGMSERVFKAMNDAQVLIEAEDYAGARGILQPLRNSRTSEYEQAHILNLLAYIRYEQDDIPGARALYEQALAQKNLPESMQANLLLALGQVCLVQEDYVAAERWLLQLLALPRHDTDSNRVLLAMAMLRQGRYEEALEPLRGAVESRFAADNQPPENWLSMLASIYYELKDYVAMRDVMQELLTLYPREQYLLNLAALHGELGDVPRQLALVESLRDEDRLSRDNQLRMLAHLFLAQELPYKAAVLMESEMTAGRISENMANYELLSQAWLAAAETKKAIGPLTAAAELSDTGDLYLRVAQLQMDTGNWDGAEEAARNALRRGGLRQEGQAWLLRGMAQVRLHRLTRARELFGRAAKFDSTERYAEQWLVYVDNEIEKQASLEAAIATDLSDYWRQ